MNIKNNQKGFGIVEGLLVLVIIGMLGGVGWYVWSQNQTKETSEQSSSTASQSDDTTEPLDEYANWETASFELVEASFKYPDNLKLTHEVNSGAADNTGFETYTLTADDNTFIEIIAYHFLGGFTGEEPKYLIDEVVTGTDKANNREFSALAYKNDNGVYDSLHVMDSTQTKYKVGEEKQLFLTSFAVKPKGVNKDSSKISITFSGPKYTTYKTLAELKSIGAYQDIEKFLNALNIPAPK